ncbi:glycoside hydrolase family 47 protein [Lentinula edodes]|uniref:alpha-1,2-Mannosidase n=1 Tax=Lentinula edodes TaxID=5353 RepID=A0A1Q3E4F0_LENED|nr:glycoside hydrolase family 47 protein [Lentinula edodes]
MSNTSGKVSSVLVPASFSRDMLSLDDRKSTVGFPKGAGAMVGEGVLLTLGDDEGSSRSEVGLPNALRSLFDSVFLFFLSIGPDGSSSSESERRGPRSKEGDPEVTASTSSTFVQASHGLSERLETKVSSNELAPMSGKIHNNFNGWGVTIYDALDTMWIMGLTEYFEEAVKVIGEASYTTKPKQYVPFFETIIRHLGGLLSAYALSKDPILLQQADRMGEMLLPAFNSESGLPAYAISTRTNATRGGWTGNTLWAEALSNQLEYKYLAHITGKPEYFEKAERCMQLMYEANVTDGIFPTQWNTKTGAPSNNKFSVGAFADSAHEYLLKQWLMTSRSETKIKDLYLNASKSIIEHLLYITPNREMLYVTDADMLKPSPPKPNASPESPRTTTQGATSTPSSIPSGTFEHLSCFLPGLLALGVQTLDLPESEKEIHSWAAEGLAYSCWLTYADMKTGLGPDVMSMKMYPKNEDGLWLPRVEKWKQQGRSGRPPGLREPGAASEKAGRDYTIYNRSYLLRPEALESFYIMWRTTGNPVWRERGWTIFQAIEKYAKTEIGYASIVDVDKSSTKAPVKDEMPSYFLAETLKYLYLLFTDEEIIPLDRTKGIRWIHVPFETFLEHKPPVPTLQPQQGQSPKINSFLRFPEDEYVLSMSLRDPTDRREMPANTNVYVTANCIRGVKKVTPSDWRSYMISCNPDIIFSLSDIPFTTPPYSQKRLTKSIERSALWLAHMLHSGPDSTSTPSNVFVQMVGGASAPARTTFAESLVEVLHGKEADAIQPRKCLDEGVAGYVFDMVPLRLAIEGVQGLSPNHSTIVSLIQASLLVLPPNKPRLVTSARGPHEMLLLIREVGIDLFDTYWAQRAANIGVALDFSFPAPIVTGKRDLGHNLYDTKYTRDFTSMMGNHDKDSAGICLCAACSPYSTPSPEIIRHSSMDEPDKHRDSSDSPNPPYTKAFLHHLLHTHEMSAHSLLAMHNITVMDAFFAGIRGLISHNSASIFEAEIRRFFETYMEDTDDMSRMEPKVFERAEKAWGEVELLRGKGRIARETERVKAESAVAANEVLKKEMEEKGAEGAVNVPLASNGEVMM